MNRILILTDFSELAVYANNLAHMLFENQEIEIRVLSVITLTEATGEFRDDGSLDLGALEVMKAEMEYNLNSRVDAKTDLVQRRQKRDGCCCHRHATAYGKKPNGETQCFLRCHQSREKDYYKHPHEFIKKLN